MTGVPCRETAAARIQAIDTVFDVRIDRSKTQSAAAVSIEPRRAIHEIRRIGDDEVAALVDLIERALQDRPDVGDSVQPRIDQAVSKRLGIDVGQMTSVRTPAPVPAACNPPAPLPQPMSMMVNDAKG